MDALVIDFKANGQSGSRSSDPKPSLIISDLFIHSKISRKTSADSSKVDVYGRAIIPVFFGQSFSIGFRNWKAQAENNGESLVNSIDSNV